MAVRKNDRLKNWVTLVAISCMAFAATCGGRIVCLCSDDPDGCGEPCHVCGEEVPDGLSATEPCNHFSFSSIDFWTEDRDVMAIGDNTWPAVHGWARILVRHQIPTRRLFVLHANAPPGRCSDSVLFRVRRVLLLS